ncbi:MAG: hypothetical protein KDE27_25370 [Planctomycetes bacterium]|nr:hypothetical protein [Planctomycetota bacterium]
MFEALNSASPQNKYKVEWVELAPVQFQTELPRWLQQLGKSSMMGGPPKQQRIGLVDEFYRLLHVQKKILAGQVGPQAAIDAARADTSIRWFADACRKQFGAPPKTPGPESDLNNLLDRHELLSGKLELLDEKLRVVNYWRRGASAFPEHQEGQSLMFQYLANAPSAKVRLILEVLCADAEKVGSVMAPEVLKTSFSRGVVKERSHETVWTDERFKKAVKAEATAAYGVEAKGQCELEFKGFKATLDAEAWAGIRAKAEGSAGFSAGQGAFAKGTVEAEIGIKLKGSATIDCADVFLCEASAEAFAGAMAKGECEISVSVGQVTVKASAEAFAGARLVGEAKATLKIQGYEILAAEAKGALTAGIGGKAEFEFKSTLFGGTSLKVEAGATLGVGAEAGTKFTMHKDNVAPAFVSLFYSAYLGLLGRKKEKYVWKTYFREIADNVRLFDKARGVIEDRMKPVILERNRLFTEFAAWKQLEHLAAFRQNPGAPRG